MRLIHSTLEISQLLQGKHFVDGWCNDAADVGFEVLADFAEGWKISSKFRYDVR